MASFRVSNQNYCFHPEDRKRMMGTGGGGGGKKDSAGTKDYLGLALLTKDLRILTSVVVNLKPVGFPAAEDFRLFVLHNQLYVNSYDLIAPLWLLDRPPPPSYLSSSTGTATQHTGATNTNYVMVPTVFGNEKNEFMVWVGKQNACAGCNRPNACGKNLNYFVPGSNSIINEEGGSTTTTTSNRSHALVEIWPSPPHVVHSMDLTQPCRRADKPSQTFASQDSPIRSFATIDEKLFPGIPHHNNRGMFTRGRGGTCCIELPRPKQQQQEQPVSHLTKNQVMLVGIQHSKTPWRRGRGAAHALQANHYLSSFYAFEPTPPYRLIAQSGYFCLPFASSVKKANSSSSSTTPFSNTIIQATAWRTLKLGNETFANCPRIHFVSGMVLLNAADGGDAIVSYGVNDCYSKFLRIPQDEILRLLYDPQSQTL